MGVNEAGLNLDKYDNNKVSVNHQFLISDCAASYLMTINDACIQANTLICTKTAMKTKLVTTEMLYRYLSLFINTKLCCSYISEMGHTGDCFISFFQLLDKSCQ